MPQGGLVSDIMNNMNIKFKAHLTENHQLQAADELIAKLRLELGQEKSYNDELQEYIKLLEKNIKEKDIIIQSKTESIKRLQDKYSIDVNNFLREDLVYQKIAKRIECFKDKYEALLKQNERLISELVKLNNEKSNKQMVSDLKIKY